MLAFLADLTFHCRLESSCLELSVVDFEKKHFIFRCRMINNQM